jgi:gluconate 5-dehydrogenase
VDYRKLFDLEGKAAVVTGASGGIGRAIALGLAAHGADVLVAGRNPGRTAESAEQVAALGRRSAAFELEVSSRESARAMAAKAIETFGHIDILVNSAGMNIRKNILDINDEDWDPVLTVNLKGTLYCCQAVGRCMVEQKHG